MELLELLNRIKKLTLIMPKRKYTKRKRKAPTTTPTTTNVENPVKKRKLYNKENLFEKHEGKTLEELQEILPQEEYMKIFIQRVLADSKFQENPNNSVIDFIPMKKETNEKKVRKKRTLATNVHYKDEISMMSYSFGLNRRSDSKVVSILQNEIIHQAKLILSCISEYAISSYKKKHKKEPSHYINITLDLFAESFMPDEVTIRKAEYIVALIRRHKGIKNSKGDEVDFDLQNDLEDDLEDDIDDEFDGDIGIEVQDVPENRFYMSETYWHPKVLEGEPLDIIHDIHDNRRNRLFYRNAITEGQTVDDYFEFSQCCAISFSKPRSKFRNWLTHKCNLRDYRIKFNKEISDVISFLIYSYLEDLIDKVIDDNNLERDLYSKIFPEILIKELNDRYNNDINHINIEEIEKNHS
eukprot:TRINITY_DN1007_c0_g1_i9.p1 TRINITY_DN1007_c0_g1~~TRINITY_DN1007_c0_g1_i9.p1  ORF type:complete len:411 (-),score=96.85 TRINITY_DN1007_c0_g1_i9:1115-2347(-)